MSQKNFPSLKKLSVVFGDKAQQAKNIMRCGDSRVLLEASPAAREYVAQCFNKPPLYFTKLIALNELAGAHGVESLERSYATRAHWGNREFADYLNMGDPYIDTVIYWRGMFRVQSVGDFIEAMQGWRIKFV